MNTIIIEMVDDWRLGHQWSDLQHVLLTELVHFPLLGGSVAFCVYSYCPDSGVAAVFGYKLMNFIKDLLHVLHLLLACKLIFIARSHHCHPMTLLMLCFHLIAVPVYPLLDIIGIITTWPSIHLMKWLLSGKCSATILLSYNKIHCFCRQRLSDFSINSYMQTKFDFIPSVLQVVMTSYSCLWLQGPG